MTLIVLHISSQLRMPIIRSRLRHARVAAARVLVPKTAVDEDNLLTRRKDDVWFPWERPDVLSKAITETV